MRGIVFDLDDTLYLERHYVRSGFSAVARFVASATGRNEKDLFWFLWDAFESGVRGRTFDRLLEANPDVGAIFRVEELVELYRYHVPEIRLLPGVKELLSCLRRKGLLLGILSDGPLASQASKVKALGLETMVDLIVLTDSWGKHFWKPHPRGFQSIAGGWGLPPESLCYVGDNPDKDFLAPKALGWYTVRIRQSGQLRYFAEPPSPAHAPDVTVQGLEELLRELYRRL